MSIPNLSFRDDDEPITKIIINDDDETITKKINTLQDMFRTKFSELGESIKGEIDSKFEDIEDTINDGLDKLSDEIDKQICDLPNYNIDEEEITEKIDKLQKDVDDIVYIMKYQIVPALNYLIKKI